MGHVHFFKLKDAHQRTRVHETTNKLVVQNTNSYLSIYACFRMRPSPCHRCRLGRKRPQPLGAKIPLKRKTVVLIALIFFQFVVFFFAASAIPNHILRDTIMFVPRRHAAQ